MLEKLIGLAFAALGVTVEVHTPSYINEFTGCTVTEAHVIRHGTVADYIATCAARNPIPQGKGWTPVGHPDGGIQYFESSVWVTGHEAYTDCVFVLQHFSPYLGNKVIVHCLSEANP